MTAFSEVIYDYLDPFPPGTVHGGHSGGYPVARPPLVWGNKPGDNDARRPPRESGEVAAVASLLTAISLKVAAAGMPKLEATMDARIAALIDDYCGTPPHSPWPWPWESAYGVAAGLSFVAGTLAPQSRLQTAVAEVSVHVLRKVNEAALNPQPLPP
jgi:hypothetical protein